MDLASEATKKRLGLVLGRLGQWGCWLHRLIDARLTLVIGLSAFLLATGVDAPNTSAKAINLKEAAIHASSPAAASWVDSAAAAQARPLTTSDAADSEFDAAIAKRLIHSDLTHSVLTGSHLTRAHFFTPASNRAP